MYALAYNIIDMVERIKINSKILLPNTTISLIFDRNSWVFAVRIQSFMENEQESPSSLTEKGYIRILNLKFCIVASMKMMVVMISDDEAIMKGEHTNAGCWNHTGGLWPVSLVFIIFFD
jgi:hypothetical protein